MQKSPRQPSDPPAVGETEAYEDTDEDLELRESGIRQTLIGKSVRRRSIFLGLMISIGVGFSFTLGVVAVGTWSSPLEQRELYHNPFTVLVLSLLWMACSAVFYLARVHQRS